MLPIFESILPIFLLIVLGNLLSRAPLFPRTAWQGMEQMSYWVLYPVLLFNAILAADMSNMRLDALLAALLITLLIMGILVMALWPVFRATGTANGGEFSSIFQTSMRWNGFIALAVAQKLYPPQGAAVVALAMATIIIPLNISSVAVVIRFGTGDADWKRILKAMATNPLIIGVASAIVVRLTFGGIYAPLQEMLGLLGGAAIGLGLLTIGAGLRVADAQKPRFAMVVPIVLKLMLWPALLTGVAYALGVRGPELVYLALCGSVPTAMNGYVLARQLGGDAEFYAAETTLQTAAAFITMPVALALAAQLASG